MYDELSYQLALKDISGIGNVLAIRLLKKFGEAKNIFEASKEQLLEVPGIGISHIKSLKSFNNFLSYQKEQEFMKTQNLSYHNILSDEYEINLKECTDAPMYYFSKGKFTWQNRVNIAIVGTRQITTYGRQVVDELLKYLAQFPINIISGFAYGTDIYTHNKCIELNIPTIAVLAHGFDTIYPKIHKKFIKPILENGGFITEYKSGTQPERENFLQRNRIIAGLSKTTIVIESAFGGGAITTANYAFNYDREVFAVAGKVQDVYSQGCNMLIKKNIAQIYTQPNDLEYLFEAKPKIQKEKAETINLTALNIEEQHIYNYLSKNGKTQFDTLAHHLNSTTSQLMNTLLVMEFAGIIKQSAGKYFEI